jgi:hypothetical protein
VVGPPHSEAANPGVKVAAVESDADRPDDEIKLIPCLEAPMTDAKEILAACADADIEASLARGACCGNRGCGCAPKMQLLVAPQDVPRVASLLQNRWNLLLEREGVDAEDGGPVAVASTNPEGEHQPCPACGTAAALVEGACSDCGLQLE